MKRAWLAAMAAISAVLSPTPANAIEVAFERDSRLPLVYLNIAVRSGAVEDPEGQSGIANFMGEMLLRGTKTRTKEQIDLAIDQMGAQLAVETRAEALILRGAVLSSQLDSFLDLLSELVTHPSFPEREIKKLKSEVVSGILEELGNDHLLAGRRFNQFLFGNHPYGKPILGKIRDVEALTEAKIRAHYDRLFRDKRLLVVGTGDATEDRIKTWADALARARAEGEDPVKVSKPEDATLRRLLIVDKPDRTQTQIAGGQIGIRMTDPNFFPLYLANHAFGGGSFSARLMTEIRVKRGWSYGAYSYFRHGRQPRLWSFSLSPANKDAPDALATVLKMAEELRTQGITPEEFDFAQQSLINNSGFMYNTPQARVENKLLERTLDLPDGFMKSYAQELEKVTLDQANSAVKEFLKPGKLAITIVATAKDLKEPLAKAAGIPPEQVRVVPYTEE